MGTINIAPLVIAAQKKLVAQPYDVAHDVAHHYRVYEGCFKIVETENLTVDKDVLTVSAWFHDVEDREGEKTKVVENILRKNNCGDEFIRQVILVIGEHSFEKKQTTLESKVLYDADKLEYVNPFRLNWFIQAAHDGLIDKKTYLTYQKEWRENVYKIPATLHFNYSKKEFSRMLPGAERIMKI